jgi:hypothetical protein
MSLSKNVWAGVSERFRGIVVQGTLGLGILMISGCGGSGDNTPRYAASGTVLLEGAPVDGAVVAFTREDGEATAVAMTDEMGQFQLNVPPGKRGVPVGKYKVTVRKSSVAVEHKEPTTFEEMERDHKAGRTAEPPPAPKLGVPARYGDPATSQLTEEVTSGKNEFTIQLKG